MLLLKIIFDIIPITKHQLSITNNCHTIGYANESSFDIGIIHFFWFFDKIIFNFIKYLFGQNIF